MKTAAGLVGRANPTALFIGAVAAVSTIAIAVGLVVFATRGDGGDEGKNSANAAARSSTTTSSTSSPTTTSSTAPALAPSTAVPGGGNGAPSGGDAELGQDPRRAYAEPDDPPYEALPLPYGISATLGSCTWNGGELQASGTVTAAPEADDGVWFVTVYWLQNDRELDEQFKLYPVEPGQTTAWNLTTAAPLPPAEPFRCALEVE
jgi:hypothetical protein